MSIVIQPYERHHEDAVRAFNARLRAAGIGPDLVFYEQTHPEWLEPTCNSPLYNQYFVAVENGDVRGAYALKYERFHLRESGDYRVACYHHPLSEGIIDRRYSSVGGLMLRDALAREPMLYALGMGGDDRPLPKMLKVIGWPLASIPFYFHVVRPFRFLREMNVLRQSPLRCLLMDFSAFTGMGWLAISALQTAKRITTRIDKTIESATVDEFPASVEALWHSAKNEYAMTSVRDYDTLARLYPGEAKHLTRLCITRNASLIGWAVVGERRPSRKFGALRVGSIVDCWARPDDTLPVIHAAKECLIQQDMDLIVTNQSHTSWCEALSHSGFLTTASSFVFAPSRQHSATLKGDVSQFHITRANGDGLPRNF